MAKFIIVLLVIAVALINLGFVNTSPLAQLKNDQELSKKFVEFLEQDKQLSSLLEAAASHAELSRHKRQASSSSTYRPSSAGTTYRPNTDVEDVDSDGDTGSGAESGFFARAAQFVMEVLQRFLKWVNNES